jgi:hypothetical protein
MPTRERRLRKFEPGTYQEERFALAKQAVMAHRRHGKSDVANVQLASPRSISSSAATINTRVRNYINQHEKRVAGLSYADKLKVIFPRATLSRSKALEKVTFESPVTETIFRQGGATAKEIASRRIAPGRMAQIVKTYIEAQGVAVYSGEKALVAAMREAGATATQAEEVITSRGFGKVGGRLMGEVPFVGGRGIFVADKDQLKRRWEEVFGEVLKDPNRRKLIVASHEASELALRGVAGTNKVASHRDLSIYTADIEFAARTDRQSVLHQLKRHELELPGVVKQVKGWTDADRSNAGLQYLSSLPKTYTKVLERAGYSSTEVKKLVTPISNIIFAGATKPKPQIATPSRVRTTPVKQPELEQVSPTLSEFRKKYSGLRITPGYAMGTSSWARWQREGGLPKESVQWAIDDSHQNVFRGFYLKYGDKEHLIDLTQKGSSRLLEDLELKVARGVDDTSVVKAIQTDRSAREAAVRRAVTREQQTTGNRIAVDHPKKRKIKQAAKKSIDAARVKDAQKAAEFALPAKLEDYVSQGVKQFREHHNLSMLRRAAPYAIGIAVGADVLASRDKTGPFWGGAAAGLAWLLTRGRAPRNTRLLISAGGYAAGRVLGGALATAHSGQLDGFPEHGFAVAQRRTHTDFGSGWRGIFNAPKAIKRTFEGMLSSIWRKGPISGFDNIRPNKTLKKWEHKPEGEFSGPRLDWFNKISESYAKKGIPQAAQVAAQKEAGTFYKNLPVVRHESYSYRGMERSYAHPTMEFSAEEVSTALVKYAKEKGIKNVPNYWKTAEKSTERAVSVISSPFTDITDMTELANSGKEVVIGGISGISAQADPLTSVAELAVKRRRAFKQIRKLERAPTEVDPFSNTIARPDPGLPKGGSHPRSINEAVQATGTPSPAFHHPIGPFDTDRIEPARSVVKTAIVEPGLSVQQIAKAENNFRRDYGDYAYSRPNGALWRRSRPKVLESFRKQGMAGAIRKANTDGDFGTGWDPARKLAKALFGKAAKEGIDKVARGDEFKRILRSEEFQKAITSGDARVIKELGAGGVGSVQLMETKIGGERFRFARKIYEEGDDFSRAMEVAKDEAAGLRAMQGSIAPTPYGRGFVAKEGREVPAMYFEAIEDAVPAALKELHGKGLYHSDVKPANMLVDKEGRLVLIDPMPSRYKKVKGMPSFVQRAVGQQQDRMAADMLSSGAAPAVVRSEMNILANALPIAQDPSNRHYLDALSKSQNLFDKAGFPEVGEMYGIPRIPKSQASVSSSVGSASAATANDLPTAAKGIRRQSVPDASKGHPAPPPSVGSAGQVASASPITAATARPGNRMAARTATERTGAAIPSAMDVTRGAIPRARTAMGESATSVANRVRAREQLHEQAVRTAATNNMRPSRRHRTM